MALQYFFFEKWSVSLFLFTRTTWLAAEPTWGVRVTADLSFRVFLLLLTGNALPVCTSSKWQMEGENALAVQFLLARLIKVPLVGC